MDAGVTSMGWKLTTGEARSVRQVRRMLLAELRAKGVRVRATKRLPKNAGAQYVGRTKTILLWDGPSRYGRPMALDKLVVLAHEYGHHLNRDVESVDDARYLLRESRAWIQANRVLDRLGLQGKRVWKYVAMRAMLSLSLACLDVWERDP